jgi:hypothetical protein
MRIEDVGVKSLILATDDDLKALRFGFMQVFDRYREEGTHSEILKKDWTEFISRYLALREEMNNRRLPISAEPAIERYVLKILNEEDVRERMMNAPIIKKLTPAQQKEYDAETALIAENAKKPAAKRVHKFVPAKWTSKNGHPRCLVCGQEEPIGGICNKVAKADEESFPISKPETTATLQRIPVATIPQGHEVRTMEISAKDGISALYDVTAKKIVTYLFDNTKFTMTEAHAWVDAHMKKETKKEESSDKEMLFKITKKDAAQQIVGGVVYEPNKVDSQGDFTDTEEITKTMYGFMEKYGEQPKRIKVMHKGAAKFFPILECFQPEHDTKKGGDTIKSGAWWMMIKVTDAGVWKEIESGVLTGFSIGGMARQGESR